MSIIRQDIVNAVDTVFDGILVTNGYRTNLGQNVFQWRGPSKIEASEIPCVVIQDETEDVSLVGAGKGCSQERTLIINYHVYWSDTDSQTVVENLRKCQADIEDALRQNYSFSNLARWTRPKANQIGFSDTNNSDLVGVLSSSLEIIYNTGYFNPEG